MPPQLNQQQIDQYFAEEGPKANPLSPLDWLSRQNQVTSEPVKGPSPQVPGTSGAAEEQITSSAQPGMNVQGQQAASAAGQALSPQSNSFYDFLRESQQAVTGQRDETVEMAQDQFGETTDIIDLKSDIEMERTNMEYANAFQDLQRSHKAAVQSARATAVQLNPYSQTTQAQTSKNYEERINDKYQQKEAQLRAQAGLARRAIEAGDQEAYMRAQQSMNQTIQQANSEAAQTIRSLQQEARQFEQFQLSYEQDERQLQQRQAESDASIDNQNLDNFRMMLTQSALPEPGTLQEMVESENIASHPVYQQGRAAGLSHEGVLRQMSDQARIQSQDERYRQAQIASSRRGGSGGSGNTITLTEAQNRGLPFAVVGMSENDVAASMYSSQPPAWFREKAQNEMQQNLTDPALKQVWDDYRIGVTSAWEGFSNESTVAKDLAELKAAGSDRETLRQAAINSGVDPDHPLIKSVIGKKQGWF